MVQSLVTDSDKKLSLCGVAGGWFYIKRHESSSGDRKQ